MIAAGQPIVLAIDDASAVGEARRTATALAGRLGFDETGRGRVAIVVTEVATNLHKHARGGELILRGVEQGEARGLEVLAIDRGPGMADPGRCLADGFSTAGSPGNGLGAIARLTGAFAVHSEVPAGTVLSAILWAVAPAREDRRAVLDWGAVSVPAPGEEVCGDAWAVAGDPERTLLLVVDGLGHGPLAAEASREAVRVFHARAEHGPAAILHSAHDMLRSTRGAAMAVALVELEQRQVRYCGVGNISGVILDSGRTRGVSMLSHNGTVGHVLRKVQEFTYPWTESSLLVMHSDGLTSHWQLDRYAGLAAGDPRLTAGVLYRDFRRGRDDVTVLAARQRIGSRP